VSAERARIANVLVNIMFTVVLGYLEDSVCTIERVNKVLVGKVQSSEIDESARKRGIDLFLS
jgi:hypothetical protein